MALTVFTSNATTYREKYAAVLEHYRQNAQDGLKYKAALFLIDNMDGHQSPEGDGIELYQKKIMEFRSKTNIEKLSEAWKDCNSGNSGTRMMPDSSVVSCKYLIDNIDDAFSTWDKMPWKKEITFKQFCEYILPYRVKDEHLCEGWRLQLRQKYKSLLKNVTDMKSAFAIIRNNIFSRMVYAQTYTPYDLDVMSYEHIRRTTCEQRSLIFASVLRAFAIPVAIDNIPVWADYSTMGHSWVSLVMNDGATYTVYENDTVAKRYNKIDASRFLKDNHDFNLTGCPSEIKSEKKVSKIYRTGYARKSTDKKSILFSNPFAEDVSDSYGLRGYIKVPIKEYCNVYLCTFLTGKNWIPVAKTSAHKGYAVFRNLGKDVVYLPVVIREGKYCPLSTPILLDSNNKIHYFPKASHNIITISVDRKYPLCSNMPDQWSKLISCVFEASNDSLFKNADTLAVINTIPYGNTVIDINNRKKYRYVRFRSPVKQITLISELSFLTKDNDGKYIPLNGRNLSKNVDTCKIALLHDNNDETAIKALKPGYWIGLDFGANEENEIARISFSPVSDGNDIRQDHHYELYGFDTSWKLIDSQSAKERGNLTFNDVPKGMLLLLKDKTEGHEERIFLYKDGKQVWY